MSKAELSKDQQKWAASVLGRADAKDARDYHRSQEATKMTERQPLKDRVKNILGLNLHDLTDMSGWTPEIRQGMALVEMSGEIDRMYDTGCGLHSGVCEQIRFLLRRWTLILGAVACLGVIGGLIALAVSIWSAAHAGVH